MARYSDSFSLRSQFRCPAAFLSISFVFSQLGLGDSIDRNIPSKVPIDGCLPQNIVCGWWHTLMLAEAEPSK